VTQLAELETRVTRLEERVDDVHDLARRTGEEVATWRATLNNHGNMINALGDHIDARFDRVEAEMRAGFANVRSEVRAEVANVRSEMRDGFAMANENFAKIEGKFTLLHQGQEQIAELLTRHLGEPDERTRAGDAGE
jgi:hypothetical protein